ncbi:MAP kinase kinase (MEK), partial [Ascosphaera pollenicola]
MGPPPNRFSPNAQSQSQFSFANPLSTTHDRPPPGVVPLHSEPAEQGKPLKGGGAGVGVGSADLAPVHTYGGPIKFYSLAKSLYGLEKLRGSRRDRDAILFAAADLKALADLLPLACSMAEEKKETVIHLAVMGREQVSLEGIQRVNSWSSQDCPVVWHDARPNYGPWSTEKRMVTSTRAAMIHLYNNIDATVVITHDKTGDEPFFLKGIEEEAKELDVTHIALPGQSLDFTWLSKLNVKSLEA